LHSPVKHGINYPPPCTLSAPGGSDPSHVVRDLRMVLKNARLRRIRFHDLRHTYASLLLQNGESPVYVKEQMGHHSIQITVDTYGHLIQGQTDRGE
jgi:integrase